MTANQYYKQTSDMAFHLTDYRYENGTVKANILMLEGSTVENINKMFKENDFFGLADFKGDIDLDNPTFQITFIFDKYRHMTYDVVVCDVIDCRVAGGDLVLSCANANCIENVDETPKEDDKKSTDVATTDTTHSIFSPFFDFPTFKWPEFPKIDEFFNDIDKKFDDMKNNWKKDGSKFCSVSYSIDGDGHAHYRKVDNDGVIEKHFMKDDKGTYIEESLPEDDKKSDDKTELKDLLK